MPWFRVDDTFAFDQKAVAAGNAAIGLWTRAGSWSAQQLTDGFVPTHMVAALGGSPGQVHKLVAAGLWEKADGGHQIVDWNRTQPTRADVERDRASARDRMRRNRVGRRSREHTPHVRGEVRPSTAGPKAETIEKAGEISDVDQTVTTTTHPHHDPAHERSALVKGLRSYDVRPNTTRTSAAVTPALTRPCPTSSPSPPHHRDSPSTKGGGGGSPNRNEQDPTDAAAAEVVAALGPPWQLGQRAVERLTPALTQALRVGWTADDLADHLRASPDGVRNTYAVLAARLADLPAPPDERPRRPEWCRGCNATTRMRETDDGRPYRCPACHPANTNSRPGSSHEKPGAA